MKKRIFLIVFLIGIFCIQFRLYSQTFQGGISNSGATLIISAKPDQDVSGQNFSGANVTIKWLTSYGVTLGNFISSTGDWSTDQENQTSGSYTYNVYSKTSDPVGINWNNGTTHELFRVDVNQTGNGVGTFELAENGFAVDWFFELGGANHTNTTTPYYQSSTGNVVPLPVELSSFTVSVKQNVVNLNWQTKTEVNNYGFEVERLQNYKNAKLQDSDLKWEKIGFVTGNGNSNSPKDYSFIDKNLTGGSKFTYRLKQIDNDGTYSYSSEVEVEVIPDRYELYQNYPNPFNPVTNIKFSLPEAARVKIDIFNIIGEKVRTLIEQNMEAGFHNITFNAENLSSGTYIYRLQTENFTQIKKMLLLK